MNIYDPSCVLSVHTYTHKYICIHTHTENIPRNKTEKKTIKIGNRYGGGLMSYLIFNYYLISVF